jgi:hypothetical protein
MARRFQVDPWGVVVQVHRRLPKCEAKDVSPQTFGLTWTDKDDEFLVNVWFSPRLLDRSLCKDKTAEREQARLRDNIIVHETVHIVQFLEQAVSAKLDCESQAYLTAWLVDKLREVLGLS